MNNDKIQEELTTAKLRLQANETWITPTHWENSSDKSAKQERKTHKLDADLMADADYCNSGDGNDDLAQIEHLRHILHFLTCESSADLTVNQILDRKCRNINTLFRSFEEQLTDLEQHLLRKTIRIDGLPEEPGYENTFKMVKDFLSYQLNLEVQPRAIDSCYRCGDASVALPRPIVATFHDKHFLNKVLNRVQIARQGKGWSVCEELCPGRLRVKDTAISLYGPKRVTVEDGIVVVRTPHYETPMKFSTWYQFWRFMKKYEDTRQ